MPGIPAKIIEDNTAQVVREEGGCYGPDILPLTIFCVVAPVLI
jgi:hypothetical protein